MSAIGAPQSTSATAEHARQPPPARRALTAVRPPSNPPAPSAAFSQPTPGLARVQQLERCDHEEDVEHARAPSSARRTAGRSGEGAAPRAACGRRRAARRRVLRSTPPPRAGDVARAVDAADEQRRTRRRRRRPRRPRRRRRTRAASTPPTTGPTNVPTPSSVLDETFAATSSCGVRASIGTSASVAGPDRGADDGGQRCEREDERARAVGGQGERDQCRSFPRGADTSRAARAGGDTGRRASRRSAARPRPAPSARDRATRPPPRRLPRTHRWRARRSAPTRRRSSRPRRARAAAAVACGRRRRESTAAPRLARASAHVEGSHSASVAQMPSG